jgi:hypothetical protein
MPRKRHKPQFIDARSNARAAAVIFRVGFWAIGLGIIALLAWRILYVQALTNSMTY